MRGTAISNLTQVDWINTRYTHHTMQSDTGATVTVNHTDLVPVTPERSLQSGSASANSAVKSQKRPSKPQGPEYEYFQIVAERPNGKGYRLRCMFCDAREMNSHAPRMRKHLVYKCTGNVPEAVKEKFRNHKIVYTKNELRKSGRKRKVIRLEDTTDEDEEDDLVELIERNRQAELLSLMNAQTRKLEETTSARKPLKQFTESDFDREHKELQTKKMRLEIKVLEQQAKFWSRLAPSADKVVKAADILINSTIRTRVAEPQVHTLYTNADGSAVLQAAYAETIANGSNDVA